jgi:hypothetical protein
MKKLLVLFSILALFATTGAVADDRLMGEIYGIEIQEITAPSGNPDSARGWIYAADNGGTMTLYFEDDAGTATSLIATSAVYSALSNPAANTALDFTTYTNTWDLGTTAADGFVLEGTGAFGDISVMKIEQKTGNPTNGTMFEVITADTNVDSILVTNTTADLTADATLLTLGFTDDGDANGIFINCLDNSSANSQFKVADNGDITNANDATIGNDLTVTNDASVGNDLAVTGALDVTGTATLGTIAMDAVTPATATATLTLDGDGAGGVTIGATSTGNITLGDTVVQSDGYNMTIGEGSLTIDNDAIDEVALTITSDAAASGNAANVVSQATTTNVISVTADALTSGDMLLLDTTVAGLTSGKYIHCYDGAASDFTVGIYGGTTIAGNASTDVLTVSAGDIEITNGDIDLNSGFVAIDTAADQTTYVKRNQGATTGPVVEIEETAAAADNAALLIDQNATTATSYGLEIDTEGGTAINIPDLTTTGNGISFSTVASYTGQLITASDTLTGTANEGIIDIHTTANMAENATLLRLDADTGTVAATTNGYMLDIDDDSGAQPISYAVEINSANNRALLVSAGAIRILDDSYIEGSFETFEQIVVTLGDNTEQINVNSLANNYAAGSGLLEIYDDSTGQTNAQYLVRLSREADGDAEDHFIMCQDNSDGTDGNGDTMFSVSSGGTFAATGNGTVGGTLEVTGNATFTATIDANGAITGDGGGALSGMLDTVTNDADGKTLTIAEAGTVQTNAGAVGGGIWNLPEASTAIGVRYTFVTMAAQNFDINPDDADKILGLTDAAGDAIRNATVGNSIVLEAMDATNWAVISTAYGTWTDVN